MHSFRKYELILIILFLFEMMCSCGSHSNFIKNLMIRFFLNKNFKILILFQVVLQLEAFIFWDVTLMQINDLVEFCLDWIHIDFALLAKQVWPIRKFSYLIQQKCKLLIGESGFANSTKSTESQQSSLIHQTKDPHRYQPISQENVKQKKINV